MKPLLSLKGNLGWLLLLFLLTGCQTSSISQISAGTRGLIKKIALNAMQLTTDKLQQAYVVDVNNDIIKLSPQGKELFRYSNKTLGQLGHIDVTDPFNVLLFYPDYLTVLTLDRTMNLTGEYRLWDLGFIGSGAVGLSNDNQIWMYDATDFKLKKIDRKGNTLLESNDLSMTLNQQIMPTFILERDNWVYLNDPEIGILVFDNFGKYARTIGIQTTAFQISGEQLIYVEKGQAQSFHLQSLLTSPLQHPVQLADGDLIRIEKEVLYVARKEGGVEVYHNKPKK